MFFETPPASNDSNWIGTLITGVVGLVTLLLTHWLSRRRQKVGNDPTAQHLTIDQVADETTKTVLRHLQKRVEAVLKTMQAIFNAKGDAFWISDREGKCVYASDELARLVGLDREDVLGDGWVTNLDDNDKERVFKAWASAVQQKRAFSLKYTFIHEEKQKVRVEAIARPIVVEHELEGFIGILTRIED